jgi:hypothetical protein
MGRAIWQLSARRVLAWFLPVFLLLCGYVVFTPHPLGIDPPAVVLGIAMGWILAFRLFVDPRRQSPFIYSLPFSRARLFFYRWMIGLLIQAVTMAVLFAIIALGWRQSLQLDLARSCWFPMVRWHELSSLWPIALASLATYQASCFLLLRGRLRGDAGKSRINAAANGAFLAFAGLIVIPMLIRTVFSDMQDDFPSTYWDSFSSLSSLSILVLLSYVTVLILATTLAALYCLRRLEINS